MSTTFANKPEESAVTGFSFGTAFFFCLFWILLFIPGMIFKLVKSKMKASVTPPTSEKKESTGSVSKPDGDLTTVNYKGFELPELSRLSSIHFLGDYDRVFLRLFPESGVISRSVRTVVLDADGGFTSRETKVSLENFTRETADIMGIEFSLASALDFTCKELSKEDRKAHV